ncbi:MAG: hypothetical protein ACRDJ4_14485 [Actinomycetota bacterium]
MSVSIPSFGRAGGTPPPTPKLVLALQRCIVGTFDAARWRQLGSAPRCGKRWHSTATATTASPRVVDETVTLKDYGGEIRQLVIRGLGRETPTM